MALQAPIDYTLDIQSPFKAAAEGYQFGSAIRADRQAQEDRLAAQQAAQAKAEQDAAFAAEVQAVLANPTAEGYAGLMARDQKNAEAYQKAFGTWDKAKKDAALGEGMKVLAALDSGNVTLAQEMMNEKAAALRNGGNDQEAKAWEDAAKAAELNPEAARITTGGMLAALGGKDFLDAYKVARTMPADVQKAEAEAKTAGEKAEYAGMQEQLATELAGWNVEKAMQDARWRPLELQLRAQEAATAATNAGLKGQKLQLDVGRLQSDIDKTVREYRDEAESNLTMATDAEDTILRLTAPENRQALEWALGMSGAVVPDATMAGQMKLDVERLSGLLTKDNMRAIAGPGVMTDGDRNFALTVVSGLKTGGNQSEQIKRLEKLREKFVDSPGGKISDRVRAKYGMPKVTPPAESVADDEVNVMLDKWAPQ